VQSWSTGVRPTISMDPGRGSTCGRIKDDHFTQFGSNTARAGEDLPRILKAMTRAVQKALRRHKQLGNPVAVWRDGGVVWLSPEEIPEVSFSCEESGAPINPDASARSNGPADS
jgi:hypothetical protein